AMTVRADDEESWRAVEAERGGGQFAIGHDRRDVLLRIHAGRERFFVQLYVLGELHDDPRAQAGVLVEEPVVHLPELTLFAGAARGMRGDEPPALGITWVVPVRKADLAGVEVLRLERREGLAVEPAAIPAGEVG